MQSPSAITYIPRYMGFREIEYMPFVLRSILLSEKENRAIRQITNPVKNIRMPGIKFILKIIGGKN